MRDDPTLVVENENLLRPKRSLVESNRPRPIAHIQQRRQRRFPITHKPTPPHASVFLIPYPLPLIPYPLSRRYTEPCGFADRPVLLKS